MIVFPMEYVLIWVNCAINTSTGIYHHSNYMYFFNRDLSPFSYWGLLHSLSVCYIHFGVCFITLHRNISNQKNVLGSCKIKWICTLILHWKHHFAFIIWSKFFALKKMYSNLRVSSFKLHGTCILCSVYMYVLLLQLGTDLIELLPETPKVRLSYKNMVLTSPVWICPFSRRQSKFLLTEFLLSGKFRDVLKVDSESLPWLELLYQKKERKQWKKTKKIWTKSEVKTKGILSAFVKIC